jgi:3-methyladenine DNA glycosylase AlkD
VSGSELATRISAALDERRDPGRAVAMAAYMRDQFPFLGIPAPERDRVLRAVLAAGPEPTAGEVLDAADALWDLDGREYQGTAARLLAGRARDLPGTALARVQRLIVTKSWWDTVDELAVRVVGPLVRADPTLVAVMDRWIGDENLWLARTAILHQLGYSDATDADRLFAYCLRRSADTEFFLRKAIGWALRQYARTEPEAVRRFVTDHHDDLSGLSRREALKHLGG